MNTLFNYFGGGQTQGNGQATAARGQEQVPAVVDQDTSNA